ncbi:hypothetical protein SUGI_0488450 [Cryptomeria japonica]|uniref:protein ABIL1 n=1 Tax=Cryptomeria japonica TaxID=3369 RepID=UPI002408B9E5|nr:protein ABIL1 [Cryptomeria japonica]GLJ25516.1 hypothetical protein SUGI_0488450 [Cryptomeria japonica]
MQQQSPSKEEEAMTYDEASMQRSQHFISALQELKNLRPQLYSAAEYCEMSYLHNDQKQMVLNNLKEYAVKALVNAVDHLGTVAFKLNDLLSQQTSELSNVELRIDCLNQRLHTCQEHTDKEGIKQQQLLDTVPRYYKHYVLPSPQTGRFDRDADKLSSINQDSERAKAQAVPFGTNANKSLSWYLAAEARNTSYGNSDTSFSNEFHSTSSTVASETFYFPENEVSITSVSASSSRQSAIGIPGSTTPPNSFGAGRRVSEEQSKAVSNSVSFNDNRRALIRQPASRSKSMLSALFHRNKSLKPKSSCIP